VLEEKKSGLYRHASKPKRGSEGIETGTTWESAKGGEEGQEKSPGREPKEKST